MPKHTDLKKGLIFSGAMVIRAIAIALALSTVLLVYQILKMTVYGRHAYKTLILQPIDLTKAGNPNEFNYRHAYEGGYAATLVLDPGANWPTPVITADGPTIVSSFTFKILVELSPPRSDVITQTVSNNDLSYESRGLYFQLIRYGVSTKDKGDYKLGDYKLRVTVLEPETSPYYHGAVVSVHNTSESGNAWFPLAIVMLACGVIVSGGSALGCWALALILLGKE